MWAARPGGVRAGGNTRTRWRRGRGWRYDTLCYQGVPRFPSTSVPRTNAIVPCYPHNSGIDTRILLIRLPQM